MFLPPREPFLLKIVFIRLSRLIFPRIEIVYAHKNAFSFRNMVTLQMTNKRRLLLPHQNLLIIIILSSYFVLLSSLDVDSRALSQVLVVVIPIAAPKESNY